MGRYLRGDDDVVSLYAFSLYIINELFFIKKDDFYSCFFFNLHICQFACIEYDARMNHLRFDFDARDDMNYRNIKRIESKGGRPLSCW